MNYKKTFFVLALLALLSVAGVSRAITPDEIKAQIAALQQQIAQLLQQLADIEQPTVEWCHNFNVNLRVGDTGDEVVALGKALIKEGVLESGYADRDDYFDERLASMVVEFQEKYASEILNPYRLKRGTGYVGKSTRAKLNKIYGCVVVPPPQCLKEGESGNSLAEPQKTCCPGLTSIGPAPCCKAPEGLYCAPSVPGLFVCTYCGNGICGKGENACNCPQDCKKEKSITVISPNGGEKWIAGQSYTITWKFSGVGDKVGITILRNHQVYCNQSGGCLESPVVPNTGSYTWYLASDMEAGDAYTVKVEDMDNPSNYDESDNYFSVVTAEKKCISEGQKGYAVNNNECCEGLTKISNSWGSGNVCVSPTDTSFVCSYCGNGVCGIRENTCNCPSDCKKTENLPPVIDGVTAPTQLKVNEQGTWRIEAHDPENGSLTYAVNWGDELPQPIAVPLPMSLKEGVQTTTFTHSYSKAGTYTITFTVTDNNYKSAKTSTTVKVIEEITAICTDSDGGKDYYTSGKGTGLYGSSKETGVIWGENSNKCSARWDRSLGYSVHYDCCSDSAISNQLNESYCDANGILQSYGYQCPNGCSNGACVALPVQKSISVVLPNGREKLTVGQPYNITWKFSGVGDKVGITILRNHQAYCNQSGGCLASPIVPNTGSYAWYVASDMEVGDAYTVKVEDMDNRSVYDESDNYFSIVAAEKQCISEGQKGLGVNSDACCEGLTKISNSWPSGTSCIAPTDTSFVCSFCGNGVCGIGENTCNCPSDCKKTENLPPVIDGVTAPTQLKVNEQGTWRIEAHDPENGSLTYAVNWGDELPQPIAVPLPMSLKEGVQTTTFTHSYSKAGTYTITFTVTDNNYKSAKTSTTVKVVEEALPACSDSDGGKNYYVKGTVKGIWQASGKYEERRDACDSSLYGGLGLVENYCYNNSVWSQTYSCPYGCQDGACICNGLNKIDLKSIALSSADAGGGYRVSAYSDGIDPGVNYNFAKALQSGSQVIYTPNNGSIAFTMSRYENSFYAKQMFDIDNTQHTRKVLFNDSSIGEETFCHTSPDFYERNKSYYYICGFRFKEIYVVVQTTTLEDSQDLAVEFLRKVYNKSLNSCAAQTQTEITVISPNGGETFIHNGSPFQISWRSTNAPAGSYAELWRMWSVEWGSGERIAANLSPSGSFSWVPQIKAGGEQIPGVDVAGDRTYSGYIEARLCKSGSGCYQHDGTLLAKDLNDKPFRINTLGNNPLYLKILSPNGGETVEIGKTCPIKWTSSEILSNEIVQIGYRPMTRSSELGDDIIAKVANTGSYDWTIASNVQTGQYKITITYSNKMGTNGSYDSSDAPFSIVTATTSDCPVPNSDLSQGYYNAWISSAVYPPIGWQKEYPTLKGFLDMLLACKQITNSQYIQQCNYYNLSCAVAVEEAGSLSVVLDATTPSSGYVAKGSANAEFLKLGFSANNIEDIVVNSFAVLANKNSSDSQVAGQDDLINISIYDGTTKLGFTKAMLDSDGRAVFSNLGWIIPKATAKVLTVKADIPFSATASTIRFSLDSADFNAVGKTSAQAMAGPASPVKGNWMTLAEAMGLGDVENRLANISQAAEQLSEKIKELLKGR